MTALLSFFSLPKVALAATEPPIDSPPRSLRPTDVTIPADLAYVGEIHDPRHGDSQASSTPLSSLPLLIHIQEAHNNYEGQQHLAALLDWLVNTYGLKLILVEGGEGNVSLAYLREYGPPDNRREVADGYLKQGLVSGEEYLDIVSDYPLTLWGVEDNTLYQRNLQAFMDAESVQAAATTALDQVRQVTDALIPYVFAPDLRELETAIRAYQGGTLGLAAYAEMLTEHANVVGVPASSYPQVTKFLAVHKAETSIDLKQVPLEQRQVMAQLRTALGQARVEPLITKAAQVKAEALSREAFYTELAHLADSIKLNLASYPNLSRYIPYVTQRSQINATRLADELDALARAVRTATASTPESHALLAIVDQLELMEKLVQLRLSPEEDRRLRAMDRESALAQWPVILTEQAGRHGLGAPSFDALPRLREALPVCDRFYEAARAREQALIDHAFAKLRESREPLAVLITGGFHAPRISRALSEQGVAVMIVTPKIGEDETTEARYRAVLNFKLGKGSLEEIRRLAAPTNQTIKN